MFEVVEHQQRRLGSQGNLQRCRQGRAAGFLNAQRAGDRGQHQMRVAQASQVDEPGAAAEPGSDFGRERDRQTRLTGPARAGERDQAMSRLEGVAQLAKLALTRDQWCPRARQGPALSGQTCVALRSNYMNALGGGGTRLQFRVEVLKENSCSCPRPWTSSRSTPSARSRSTAFKRRTVAIQAYRSVRRRWPTSCGRSSCAIIPAIRSGQTTIDSRFRLATAACCCTACCT